MRWLREQLSGAEVVHSNAASKAEQDALGVLLRGLWLPNVWPCRCIFEIVWSPHRLAHSLHSAARGPGNVNCLSNLGTTLQCMTAPSCPAGSVDMSKIEEVPIAQVSTNAAGEVTKLDIDLSVLGNVDKGRSLVKQLLGGAWRPNPRLAPADLASKKVLTLEEYTKLMGI